VLAHITPIILTFNEEPNIERTLNALTWATRVLVIDSGSTDATAKICQQFANTEFIVNPFETAAKQCNFALAQGIQTSWVLSMDADYVLTAELVRELKTLDPANGPDGYEICFDYLIGGHPLRGSLYPPRVCLYRHKNAHYQQDGHTQRVNIDGVIGQLRSKIQHDDRKPFSRWLNSQKRYARLEASKMRTHSFSTLKLVDKLRRLGLGPLLIVPYTLFAKGVVLDGKHGWKYTKERLIAEIEIWSALFLKK